MVQRSCFCGLGSRVVRGYERVNLVLAVTPFWHLQVSLIGSQLSCCLTNETETRPQRGLEMVTWRCLLVGCRVSSELSLGNDCWKCHAGLPCHWGEGRGRGHGAPRRPSSGQSGKKASAGSTDHPGSAHLHLVLACGGPCLSGFTASKSTKLAENA